MSKLVDIFYKIYAAMNKNKFLQAIKQSFTTIFPILAIGSAGLLLQSFPIDVVRNFIITFGDGILYKVLSLVYIVTFGFSSLYVLVILTSKYYRILSNDKKLTMYACLNAVLCYFHLLGPSVFFDGASIITYTNMNNIFVALITSLASTHLFVYIIKLVTGSRFKIKFTSSYNTAMNVIIPLFVSGVFFLSVSVVVYLTSGNNVNDFISLVLAYPFNKIGSTYFGGLLITFFSTILFFFGIHGRTVFEDVYMNVFSNSSDGIVTNSMFECFTLIGGVGSTLCLIIALLIFTDSKRKKKVAKHATFPMVFNINEIIIYGLPIIFNPIYIIPFVLVPIVSYTIGYIFISAGTIPVISQSTLWTTPTIINGLLATDSIGFALVQLLCLAIGIGIYIPFVLLDNVVSKRVNHEMGKELEQYLINCERNMVEPQVFNLNNHLELHAENVLLHLESNIKNGYVDLTYHPQVKDGKIISVESLLRFKYESEEKIYMPLIIQIAKERDLFKDLSKEIIKKAIFDFKQILLIDPNLKISVNLDLDILYDKEFMDWMITYIKQSTLPKNQFGIEVTEKSKYSQHLNLNEIFNVLHKNHINIYMDDFSMGHTSIAFLQNTTFDYVKLDGSLVKNIDNERSRNIIESIVNLGKTLNFEVVAEYVETHEQKYKLEALGCNIYQGYLYYKPMKVEDLIQELLKKQK